MVLLGSISGSSTAGNPVSSTDDVFRLTPAVESGLQDETGWWNCITPGDFDNDGDLDFIAGNVGLNHNFQASHEWPFEVYAGDVDNNGVLDIIMAYYNEGILYPWYGFMRSHAQVPVLKYKYNSYKEFGEATLADVYGENILKGCLNYKARNFASCFFENLGNGKFKASPLPNEAQVAPVNSIIIRDIDGDGIFDLIAAGNNYGTESEITMLDGGMGLYLKGDGRGGFKPFPARETGLYLEGDVKQVSMIHLGSERHPAILAAKNNQPVQIVALDTP
jgi:hypothetical protein